MGIETIEKIITEEIRSRCLGHVEKDRRYSNEKSKIESGWITKDRNTKIEMERCYRKDVYKKNAGAQRKEVQERIMWRMKTHCIDPKYGKM